MPLNGFQCIRRTSGVVTAMAGHQGTDSVPVEPDGEKHELSHHVIRYPWLAGRRIRFPCFASQALPQIFENTIDVGILQVS